MKSYVAVLIAAVTVNCLVTTINGTPVTNTLTIPYTDMLLPPLEDVQDNSNDVASTSLSAKTTAATVSTTAKTAKITTTTQKPQTTGANDVVPKLSTEALLPPLFEAKTEKEDEKNNKQLTKNKITTTFKPTTTTKKATRKPTTVKPATTTTTLAPTKVEVPDLFLDALLPPLNDNSLDGTSNTQAIDKTTTTKKPLQDVGLFKTTKKSYYQQQTEHLKDLHLIDQDETHPKTYVKQQQQLKNLQYSSENQNYNKKIIPSVRTSTAFEKDKQVSESKTHSQQVPKTSQQHLSRNIEKLTIQHVAKQALQQKHQVSGHNANNDPQQFNYSFDLYLGSTTVRPAKSGLPTITPFPRRLGR